MWNKYSFIIINYFHLWSSKSMTLRVLHPLLGCFIKDEFVWDCTLMWAEICLSVDTDFWHVALTSEKLLQETVVNFLKSRIRICFLKCHVVLLGVEIGKVRFCGNILSHISVKGLLSTKLNRSSLLANMLIWYCFNKPLNLPKSARKQAS